MQEMISGTRIPTSPELPYSLDIWAFSSAKDPEVVGIQSAPTEASTLAKLTSQYQWAFDEMQARVDWRAANPTPPPSPPKLFDDRGQPVRHYYQVMEFATDSNFDGVADDLQFGTNDDPFDNDIDGDGIPNGYDPDLWPVGQFPETAALLSNVLINEVLLSNEFTNCDEDGDCGDWVELYNPTPNAIDLTDWHLSDSSSSSGRARWTFPTGTSIGSGQFLVVWATGKNRGGVEDINGNGVLDLALGEDFNGNGVLDVPAPIHTDFKYAASDPEPVVLSRPDPAGGTAIFVDRFQVGFTTNYAAQRSDLSFGRFPSSTGLQNGYMILPTPGAPGVVGGGSLGPVGQHNVSGALGFTDPPVFAAASDPPGLYENAEISAVLDPPATGGTLHFTTNSVHPTRYSEIYSGPITANRTTIVRAIAAREGFLPSVSITRSYLFKEDILGTSPQGTTPTDQQGARDANGDFLGLLRGYPEGTEIGAYPMVYAMHPDVVRDHRGAISAELNLAPAISVVSSMADLFEFRTGGIYPNSEASENQPDPRARDWKRLCSFEFVEADASAFKQANASLSMTGGSSLKQDVTRKHNLRVKFDSSHGPEELEYPLFEDWSGDIFTTIHLKNPTHDSWSQHFAAWLHLADAGSYCSEGWVRAAHLAMGHEGPRRRWVHLFLNGIYWGPYELSERIDDDFVRSHEGALPGASYNVLKQDSLANGVAALDGTTEAWGSLIDLCEELQDAVNGNSPLAVQDAKYQEIIALLNVENYIDYLLCHAYSSAHDWPRNNYRMARRNDNNGNTRFRFYVWDAEQSFQPGDQVNNAGNRLIRNSPDNVARPHTLILNYSAYRQKFADRVRFHFHEQPLVNGSGALAEVASGDRAVQLYQAEMAKFEAVLFCESARWGHMTKAVPFTKSDPSYLPGDITRGDWERATSHVTGTWLPQRRKLAFGHFAVHDLYVAITPGDLASAAVGVAYNQTLTATGGAAPHAIAFAYGNLPPGLSLSGSAITGTPTIAGTYSFTLSATSSDSVDGDSRPIVGYTRFTLTVSP